METTQQQIDVAVPRRARLQYSLATLMWVTTAVACVCALVAMYRRMHRAESEVLRYRDEMGYLEIGDPRNVYARMLRQVGSNKWTWRVYLPAGHAFQFCTATERIPVHGLPAGRDALPAQAAGEQLIDVDVVEESPGLHRFMLRYSGNYHTIRLRSDGWDCWFVTERQEVATTNHPLVLMRVRCHKTGKAASGQAIASSASEPCDGLMLWIERTDNDAIERKRGRP